MRTKVVFLSTPDSSRLYYGSTFLRGQQLAGLLSTRLSDYSIAFTTDGTPVDSLVVLTKGILASAKPQLFAELKAGRNILLADPVDLGMTAAGLTALAGTVDGFIASSQRQLAALKAHLPDKPSHLVTHNADRRLPSFSPPDDRLRIAYVGLAKNCRHLRELGQVANIVETPTGESADPWLPRLAEFNCHYALREDESPGFDAFLESLLGRSNAVAFRPSRNGLFGRPRGFMEFKPFTKGFTAAHCLSPVLTDRGESDAQFYLPDDYPFFLPTGPWNDVREAIRRIGEEFGGPSWRYAVEVMRSVREKSSPDHIANEFKTMLACYH